MSKKSLHNFCLYIYALSLPFEYWDPFNLLGIVSFVRIIAIFYILAALLNHNYSFRTRFTNPFVIPITLMFIFFVVSNLINIPYYGSDNLIINTSLLQNIILFWILANHLSSEPRLLQNVLLAFVMGVLLLSVLYFFEIGLVFRHDRITVFGDNPNNQGTKVAFASIILIYFTIKDYFNIRKKRFLFLAPVPLFLTFMADTGSRGAILTFILGIFLVFFLFKTNKKYKNMLLMLVGVLVALLALRWSLNQETLGARMHQFTEEGSLGGRAELWNKSYAIFLKSPVLGVGEDGFRKEMTSEFGRNRSAHNLFLYSLAVSGLLGISFLMIFIFRLYKASRYPLNYDNHLLLVLFILVLFAMFRSGGSFGDKFYFFTFAIICASQIGHQTTVILEENESNYFEK